MNKYYYKDGTTSNHLIFIKTLHRVDGPAIESDRVLAWYIDGKRHREDGPAHTVFGFSKGWYINGKCHRIDGPAVEYEDGSGDHYINGEYISREEFEKYPEVIAYRANRIIRELLNG